MPCAVAASAGSHSHTAQAWRKADRANSSARACGSGLSRMSSQSSTYSPSCAVPTRRSGVEVRVRKAVGRRVCEREEGRPLVIRIPRPPPDLDLLGIASVAHDEVIGRWIGRPSREEVDREVEGPPPGVDRRRATAKRRPEFRQDERRVGGGLEVGRHLVGVIGRMLVVLVERDLPRHLLGRGIDLDGAPQAPHGLEHLARHLRHGPVGRQRDPCLVAARCARPRPRGCAGRAPRRSRRSRRAPAARSVSQPRALSRRAACWSCGSGGASSTASFPSTWVCAWSVSQVALHEP